MMSAKYECPICNKTICEVPNKPNKETESIIEKHIVECKKKIEGK